jgi:hypothetical protein
LLTESFDAKEARLKDFYARGAFDPPSPPRRPGQSLSTTEEGPALAAFRLSVLGWTLTYGAMTWAALSFPRLYWAYVLAGALTFLVVTHFFGGFDTLELSGYKGAEASSKLQDFAPAPAAGSLGGASTIKKED